MKNASILRVSRSFAGGSHLWLRRTLSLGAAMAVAMSTASAEDHSVAAVQRALKDSQFYFGDIDGNLDFATHAALRRFQFRNGLTGTAEIDAATLQALELQAPPKAVAVAPIPVVRAVKAGSELAQQVQLDEQRFVAAAAAGRTSSSNTQKRSMRPGAISVPSWNDAHRIDGDLDEMRLAQRAVPVRNSQPTQATLQAVPASEEAPAESADAGVKIPVHFTGMDGHVYTYYKKVSAAPLQAQPTLANSQVAPFPSPPQRMLWARSSNGQWQRIDQ